jgi:hypothetical protein
LAGRRPDDPASLLGVDGQLRLRAFVQSCGFCSTAHVMATFSVDGQHARDALRRLVVVRSVVALGQTRDRVWMDVDEFYRVSQ